MNSKFHLKFVQCLMYPKAFSTLEICFKSCLLKHVKSSMLSDVATWLLSLGNRIRRHDPPVRHHWRHTSPKPPWGWSITSVTPQRWTMMSSEIISWWPWSFGNQILGGCLPPPLGIFNGTALTHKVCTVCVVKIFHHLRILPMSIWSIAAVYLQRIYSGGLHVHWTDLQCISVKTREGMWIKQTLRNA